SALIDTWVSPESEAIPLALVRQVAIGDLSGCDVGADSVEDQVASRRDRDVCVLTDRRAISHLPWEWCTAPSFCYRMPQNYAPNPPQNVMRRFERSFASKRPIRVLIAQPSHRAQERTMRGFERKSRRTLASVYDAHSMTSRVEF